MKTKSYDSVSFLRKSKGIYETFQKNN